MQDDNNTPEESQENGPQASGAKGEKEEEAKETGMEVPPVPSSGVDTATAAEPEVEMEVDVGEEGEELVEVPPVASAGVDTASAVEPADEYDLELGADVDAMGVAADEGDKPEEGAEKASEEEPEE